MSVHRIAHPGLGNASYVVDLGDGSALVVDPVRDPAPVLAHCERLGLTPRFVAETHLHADFVSGAQELAVRGARVLAAADTRSALPHEKLHDGDRVTLGGLELEAIATPGHTPEHLAYLLRDDERPVALFSGGALLAGGVARTDLVAPERTEELARAAWRSIQDKLLPLPDDLPVHPTHGGGSFCSVGESGAPDTTIGRERTANPLLQASDEDDFVRRLLDGYGSFPPYFLRLREVNRAGPRTLGPQGPALAALSPDEVARRMHDGALLVDARPIDRFAEAHVPGAVSIELTPSFGVWLGWLAEPRTPLLFVLDADQDERDLVWQALTVGLERLDGRLEGGIAAWTASGRQAVRIPLVDRVPDGAQILDVRQRREWERSHVAGATHTELGALIAGTAPERHGQAGLLVHCGHGQRAMTAASLLARGGHTALTVATVGPDRLGAGLERGDGPAS